MTKDWEEGEGMGCVMEIRNLLITPFIEPHLPWSDELVSLLRSYR